MANSNDMTKHWLANAVFALVCRLCLRQFAGSVCASFPVVFAPVCRLCLRQFVAHGHTQYLVHIAWLGEWSSWQMMGLVRKTLHVASRFLFLPLMAFVYLILPSFSCIDNWRAPINKYITFLCSYFIFLGLLFYQTNLVAENITRGPPQSGRWAPAGRQR